MIRILKEIIAFSGKKKKLFTKAMIVSFIGAVFGALQFLALMMTLDIIVGGKEAHILPVFAVMPHAIYLVLIFVVFLACTRSVVLGINTPFAIIRVRGE